MVFYGLERGLNPKILSITHVYTHTWLAHPLVTSTVTVALLDEYNQQIY